LPSSSTPVLLPRSSHLQHLGLAPKIVNPGLITARGDTQNAITERWSDVGTCTH